ncbi:hypothetical protein MMC13_008135 [Lambiella insularis]|nr:hypothetical protein [Lambiella insularis]
MCKTQTLYHICAYLLTCRHAYLGSELQECAAFPLCDSSAWEDRYTGELCPSCAHAQQDWSEGVGEREWLVEGLGWDES